MSDPRDGFEVFRTFPDGDSYPFFVGYAPLGLFNGLWTTYLNEDDDVRFYTNPDLFGTGNARGLLPNLENTDERFDIDILNLRYVHPFTNDIAWVSTGPSNYIDRLCWSDDLETWQEVDIDLSPIESDFTGGYGGIAGYLDIGTPFYHNPSGRYCVVVGVFTEDSYTFAYRWIQLYLASAEYPGGTWTVHNDHPILAAPEDAYGDQEFWWQDAARNCYQDDAGNIVFTYGAAWNIDTPLNLPGGREFYIAEMAATTTGPGEAWTYQTLSRQQAASTGWTREFSVLEDFFPATPGYQPPFPFIANSLRFTGGLWVYTETTYSPSYQQTFIWSDGDLTGDWTLFSGPETPDSRQQLNYGDGVWVYSGLDDSGEAMVYAGQSIESVTEPVAWEVSGPLYSVDIRYDPDGEWRGYCYPDDEDGYPDYYLTPPEGGGTGWGLLL